MKFTSNINDLKDSSIAFVCGGTPNDPKTGASDLSYLYSAIESLENVLSQSSTIVIKSTVPIGTGEDIYKKYPKKLSFASCPEFLREGSAIYDFMNPERIIIGTRNDQDKSRIIDIFGYFKDKAEFVHTNVTTAEMIKYAANSFLAMKVGFINEMARLCDSFDANIKDVSLGIGLDSRIGKAFLNPGPGFGGSCFPKDVKALSTTAQNHAKELPIINNILVSNQMHKEYLADFIVKIAQKYNQNNIGILGVTFKANTDDMRDSASLTILPMLKSKGLNAIIYDPAYTNSKPKELDNFNFVNNLQGVLDSTKIIVVLTEWSEFKGLNFNSDAIIIDFRNIYCISDMQKQNIKYYNLGRLNEGAN